jgi:DNA-binding NtrC family response regulator
VGRARVLIIGRSGTNTTRLRAHLTRRGLQVRGAPDCGSALEAIKPGAFQAVVLDVEGAGFAAATFREMLQQDYEGLPLVELHAGDAGPEDVGLLAAALEQEILEAEARQQPQPGTESGSDGWYETPLHGYKFEDLTSRNPRMIELFQLIPRVAQTDSPVLIVGETGTGKELVAAAIHRHSRRKSQEFFTVNCGALTDTLLESELFGHVKGAFTGAHRSKKGYFQLASDGTLFLDELGTISAAMQVKLLRVLERMEVRPVGGDELVRVDVRIVAATNAALEEAVADGSFREDLYYRLNVVQIQLPPLRERPEDIPLLAEVFRRKFSAQQGRTDVTGISGGAISELQGYPWPGNVRELQNVVERAVIMTQGPQVAEVDLPERVRRKQARRTSVPSFDVDEPLATVIERMKSAVEREYLRRVLRKYRGHLAQVSDHAGLNRRTLYNKMQMYGLKRDDFR